MTPHTNAYATFAKAGMSPRDLEASALLKAAAMLQGALAGESAALDAALAHNRRLWSVFAAAVGDETSRLPEPLRADILTLANFVFNTSLSARDAEAVERLIAINRELASGLRGN